MRPKIGSKDYEEVKMEKLKEVLGFQIFLSRIEEGCKLSKMEEAQLYELYAPSIACVGE